MTGGRNEHFLPIEDYGVIGNLHTIALVSKQDASIDHFCFPHFDSPLLFGRLLTRVGGGFYQISPDEDTSWTPKQLYLPSSNVLVTRFLGAAGGIGQVTDFLPVTSLSESSYASISEELLRKNLGSKENVENGSIPEIKVRAKGWPWLVRKVETIRGSIKFRLQCQPAFEYGLASHQIDNTGSTKTFTSEAMTLHLSAHPHSLRDKVKEVEWKVVDEVVTYTDGAKKTISIPILEACFELAENQTIFFLLRQDGDREDPCPTSEKLQSLLHDTTGYWHQWLNRCTYRGRWREIVYRSALVLKLMTFAPTGAIIAAPTTSLPETLGGDKNWDYRFTWIRDAAFTVYAFLRIGLTEEAADFMTWIEHRCREIAVSDPNGLCLMYDINGFNPTLPTDECKKESVLAGELILAHWTGYKDSQPVRIGNLAAFQHQLDIYGELLDAIYLCDKWVRPISYDFWKIIREKIVPHVIQRWNDPDHGIWENREDPQHHVYSKVMAWVALDRVIRLSQKRSLPAPHNEWICIRDKIYTSIMKNGYKDSLGVFTQHYESETIDASNLIMPLVFFLPPDDPRFLRTLEKTLLPPKHSGLTVNHLVFRFNRTEDDLEGTFTICSFWLVEALSRAGKRIPKFLIEARLMFEDIIGYANHLGLFSEEIGLDGSALGNFPQAFTHLSLISAAFNLDRTLG